MSAFFDEVARVAFVVRARRPAHRAPGEPWGLVAQRFERFAMNVEAAVMAAQACDVPATAGPERIERALLILDSAERLYGVATHIANLAWREAARTTGASA